MNCTPLVIQYIILSNKWGAVQTMMVPIRSTFLIKKFRWSHASALMHMAYF